MYLKTPNSSLITPSLQPTERSPRPKPQSYTNTEAQRSLRQLVNGFLLTYKLEGKSPLTIDDYKRKLIRFVHYIESNRIGFIDRTVVRSFLGYVRDTYSLKAVTVQRYLISQKAFWGWTVQEGFVIDNPTDKVKINIPQSKIVRGLSSDKLKTLLSSLREDSFEDVRNKAMILILLDCGLRVSELVNLKMDDVDIDKGIVMVIGKGSKQRLVPLGLKTRKVVWKYILLWSDSMEWLWINGNGSRLTSSGVQQMVRKLGEKLGIQIYPHLLRHTFAINFLRNGANTFECQYTLGHSSLEMTRRYCQALNFEDVYKKHQVASPVDNI